jgi:hypothetical protein
MKKKTRGLWVWLRGLVLTSTCEALGSRKEKRKKEGRKEGRKEGSYSV